MIHDSRITRFTIFHDDELIMVHGFSSVSKFYISEPMNQIIKVNIINAVFLKLNVLVISTRFATVPR